MRKIMNLLEDAFHFVFIRPLVWLGVFDRHLIQEADDELG
jgi:hypothetical protein